MIARSGKRKSRTCESTLHLYSSAHPRYSSRLYRRGISSYTCGLKTPWTHFPSRSDIMDFDQELKQVADAYASQGYQVTIRPNPEALPSFAKDFKIEILGRRGTEGVLVAVKKDRDEVAADSNLTRYAEITGLQKGWRFDFAILEAENPSSREIDGARDFSEEDIEKSFGESLDMVRLGFLRPA